MKPNQNFIKWLFSFFLFSIPFFGLAQEADYSIKKKNAIYTEIGGNGVLYSINYERMFYQKKVVHFAGRVGAMAAPGVFGSSGVLMFPVELNMLLGKKSSFFETGLGNSFNTTKYQESTFSSLGQAIPYEYHSHYAFFRLGYRYQRPQGGFLFRAALTPYLNYKTGYIANSYEPAFGIEGSERKNELGVWAGFSFGFSF